MKLINAFMYSILLILSACGGAESNNLNSSNFSSSSSSSSNSSLNGPIQSANSSSSSSSSVANATILQKYLNTTGTNVVPVTINGSSCGTAGNDNANTPCVSVTLCEPGTNNCQTINNILLDTGSFGLRIFKSLLTISPPALKNSAGQIYAECATFGIGADWGSLASLDVSLNSSEKASSVPVQIIDDTFSNYASACQLGAVDTDPTNAGFNGILGIGGFQSDCGDYCVSTAQNQIYYACDGISNCTESAIPLKLQVSNPIYGFSNDNNGVILAFPDISSTGAKDLSGVLILGIGTRTNNTPSSSDNFTTFPADANTGYISTNYNNYSFSALFDTGTNGFVFSDNSITQCTGNLSGFFCPGTELFLSTQITSSVNQETKTLFFNINDTNILANTGNSVFNDIGYAQSSSSSDLFILGIPAYMNRVIVIGYDGKSSPLGNGVSFSF